MVCGELKIRLGVCTDPQGGKKNNNTEEKKKGKKKKKRKRTNSIADSPTVVEATDKVVAIEEVSAAKLVSEAEDAGPLEVL